MKTQGSLWFNPRNHCRFFVILSSKTSKRPRETLLDLVPDPRVLSLTQQESANDERDRGHGDREPKPSIAIPRRRNQRCCNQRSESAEPAISEVVRQRQR